MFLLILVLLSNARGEIIQIHDIPAPATEASVNDIPFDTHELAIDYMLDRALNNIEMSPEAYINDIPFNITLTREQNYDFSLNPIMFTLSEKYINDIPFDTHEVVQDYRLAKIGSSMALETEESVNDIPFEPSVVLSEKAETHKASLEYKLLNSLPGFLMGRLDNFVKAGLISTLILLGAGILGFLFFSFVY
jgi:hypothetical protein